MVLRVLLLLGVAQHKCSQQFRMELELFNLEQAMLSFLVFLVSQYMVLHWFLVSQLLLLVVEEAGEGEGEGEEEPWLRVVVVLLLLVVEEAGEGEGEVEPRISQEELLLLHRVRVVAWPWPPLPPLPLHRDTWLHHSNM